MPVCRSPRMSSRCPRPIGIKASTTFRPVCNGTKTGALSIIAGASRSTGRRSDVLTGPRSSRGRPTGSTKRPISASPTGTSKTCPVRSTSEPASISLLSPKRITPTSEISILKTMPGMLPGNRTSSSDLTPDKPSTRAIPWPI